MRRGVSAVRTGVIACGTALIAAGLTAPLLIPSAGASVAAFDVGPRSVADDTVLGVFSPLGGVTGTVINALAVQGDDTVYAAGNFSLIGGVSASRVAAWSIAGANWHSMGGSTDNSVSALAVQGDDTVYAGGNFTQIGGVSASRVAAWSIAGATWHSMGGSTNNAVGALAVQGDDTVYAGGDFTQVGGVSASRVAAWSIAGATWHSMGASTNDVVSALAVQGDDTVYAGGGFIQIGGVSASKVAAWSNNDDTWRSLGSGLDSVVSDLAVQGDDTVYAGGNFTNAGGNPAADKIAAWSNADDTWHELGSGMTGEFYAIAVDAARGLVYAGGDVVLVGGTVASNVAVWDAGLGEWFALQAVGGQGTNGQLEALALDDSVLYLGGFFPAAGGVIVNGIARWTWDAPSAEATPATGARGATIQVRGSGLIGVKGAHAVRVNGTAVPYTRDDSTTVQVTIPGDLYDGTYSVQVDAVGGTATTTYTVTGSPAPLPPRAPGAPSGVVAVAGDGSASVSWVGPSDSGSFPVSAYEATSSPGGRSCLVGAPAVTCVVSGLVNGTGYTFTVRALNGAGWGGSSAPSDAVTPRALARPTIVITGSRDAGDPRFAVVRGVTTGLVGERVMPFVRFAGESEFSPGKVTRPVAEDGTFDWQRRTGRRLVLYFAHGAVVSNTVAIPTR